MPESTILKSPVREKHQRFKDLTGQTFYLLTAIGLISANVDSNGAMWLWKCVCGNTVQALAHSVKRGKKQSCGCLRPGVTKIPEYYTWCEMKKRCKPRNAEKFPNYSGRGIRVCDEWQNDFLAFYQHIGPRPSADYSVDRIDNNRGYEPGNVRWATRTEQSHNSRWVRNLTFNGRTMCIADWARFLGMGDRTLQCRLRRWPLERALTEPLYHKSTNRMKARSNAGEAT